LKIKIQKLGTIQNAEFDLRPLTVFVGPNNTGKTWLAYVLSAIFGPGGIRPYIQAYVEGQLHDTYPPLEDAITEILTRGDTKIDLYSFAENYGERYFNNVAQFSQHWMSDYMSTQYAHFNDITLSVQLGEMNENFLKRIKHFSFKSSISNRLLTMSKKAGENTVYIYTSSENEDYEQITQRLPPEVIKEFLVRHITQTLHRSLYPQVRIFPTERTTIVTFNFRDASQRPNRFSTLSEDKVKELIKALDSVVPGLLESRLEQNIEGAENTQTMKKVIGPVGSFIDMFTDLLKIGPKDIEKRREAARKNSDIQTYCDLADVLETEILAGNVAFSTIEPDPRRDILFQPIPNVHIEIPIASSMVKELSSFVLYLRYLAKPGELVIIDEPEMNLHPLAQVKIIELLAALVNAGLHILITTHSTYIVDHLGNLIEAYAHERKEEIIEKFMLEREDAFMDQKNVSMYEITEKGEMENILSENGTIDWKTFSDVTEWVQGIHFEL
jgi:AAA ATPase domain